MSWLAVLAEAPQSMAAVTYAVHDDGFAGHMARSPEVTRYYLQVPPGDDPQAWTDDRIWAALDTRMRTGDRTPAARGGRRELPRHPVGHPHALQHRRPRAHRVAHVMPARRR